jgi:hypothetical protein
VNRANLPPVGQGGGTIELSHRWVPTAGGDATVCRLGSTARWSILLTASLFERHDC